MRKRLVCFLLAAAMLLAAPPAQAAEGDFIRWVDFNLTAEAMERAIALEQRLREKEIPVSWLDILALGSVRSGGKRFSAKDAEKAAAELSKGVSPEELLGAQYRYFDYYKKTYEAALGGLVGCYAVETTETESEILIQLTGVNAGDIIGRRGDVLDAFQYMLNVLTKNFDDDFKRVTVDTENYRAKRAETLEKLARNLEKKVRRTAKPVRLEYMNPFERRTIHTALQDSPFVDTASEGDEPRRYVVIKPKAGLKPRPDGERRSFRGGDKKDGRKRRNENRTRRDGFDDAEETEPSAARTEPEEEKKEPTYDGGVMKKLNFVYRSEKKRRRLK